MQKLKEILEKLKKSKFLAIALANPYYLLVAAAILFTLGTYVYIYYVNLPSEAEQNLQQLNNQVTEQAPVTEQAEKKAEEKEFESNRSAERATELEKVSNTKVKKAEEARNANTSNTSVAEANKSRCAAYPESPECSKQ